MTIIMDLLTAAIAVGFGRLFSGWSFLAALALPALLLGVGAAIAWFVPLPLPRQAPQPAPIQASSAWSNQRSMVSALRPRWISKPV